MLLALIVPFALIIAAPDSPQSPALASLACEVADFLTEEEAAEQSFQKGATVRPEFYKSWNVLRSALSAATITVAQTPEAEQPGYHLACMQAKVPTMCYSYWMIQWTIVDLHKYDAVYQRLFGAKLVREVREYKSGTEIRGAPAFVAYDGRALEIAFRKLYVKPEKMLCGESAQTLYDRIFRQWVRDSAQVLKRALEQDGGRWLPDAARRYEEQALSDPQFNGTEFSGSLASELGYGPWENERLVGLIVRRARDGSLPAIQKILTTLLSDYDPEFSAAPKPAAEKP